MKTSMKIILALFMLGLAMSKQAFGDDYFVDARMGSNTSGDGSQEKPWMTISFALSQISGTGHTVHVAAGTYDTVMDGIFPEIFPLLLPNGVSLVGAGADSTIIDANKSNIVIQCDNISDTTVVIEGFTIRNGKDPDTFGYGGGIRTNSSSLTIQNNIIEANQGWYGGGIHIDEGKVVIRDNLIRNNTANDGGGISLANGDVRIVQNQFISNRASIKGGAIELDPSYPASTVEIVGNVLISNSAFRGSSIYLGSFPSKSLPPLIRENIIRSGIYCDGSHPNVINNTFVGTGSGNAIVLESGASPSITNNIIANWDYGIFEAEADSDPDTAAYNLFFNNKSGLYFDENVRSFSSLAAADAILPEMANNVQDDPLFEDSENNDFDLLPGSPAIDAGDPNSPLDPDGTRADIGARFFFQGDPRIAVFPEQIDFGGVKKDTRVAQILTVLNQGDQNTLSITNMTTSNPAFSVSRAVLSIAPADSDTVTVHFTPQFYINYNEKLTIHSNAQNAPQKEVLLLGSSPLPSDWSITINDGAAVTTSRTVTLTLNATGADSMKFLGDIIGGNVFIPFSNAAIVTLTEGDGEKTVRVIYKNIIGNETPAVSDNIILDTSQAARPALTIPDTSAAAGDNVTIPIRVTNAAGIAGAEITVTFNAGILQAQGAQTTSLTTGFTLADTVSDGKIVLSLANATAIAASEGVLVNLSFKVNAAAGPGDTTTLALENISLFGESADAIPFSSRNGLFTVEGITPVLQRIIISPASAAVEVGETVNFTAQGRDQNNDPFSVSPTWSVLGNIGTVAPGMGTATVFTASQPGAGGVVAKQGSISDTATVFVGTLGDLTADNVVDVRDAIVVLRIIVGLPLPIDPAGHTTPTAFEKWAADVNGDGAVNGGDVLLILYESLGKYLSKVAAISGGNAAQMRVFAAQHPGEPSFSVPIVISNRADVYATDVELSYNANACKVVEIAPAVSSSLMAANTQTPGKIKLSLVNTDGIVSSTGEIAVLKFRTRGDAQHAGDVAIVQAVLFDGQAKTIPLNLTTEVRAENAMPQTYALLQNYPNPVNAETTIRYHIPKESHVTLSLFNMNGKAIKTLVDRNVARGEWIARWDGTDQRGRSVPSGVYFYRLEVRDAGFVQTRKLVVMK